MTDATDYCGVPAGRVHELGRVVVVAGQTEWVAQMILEALGLDQHRNVFAWQALRKAAAGRKTPDCSTVEPAEVTAWFDTATEAMQERNVLFHAGHYGQMRAGVWVQQTEHISKRAVRDARTDDVATVRAALERCFQDGLALHGRLIHKGLVNHYVQRDVADDDQQQFQLARDNYPACPWARARPG